MKKNSLAIDKKSFEPQVVDQKQFDPLTGRRIQLVAYNGFSTFETEKPQGQPFPFEVKTRQSSPFPFQDCAIRHQEELSAKILTEKDTATKKISELANFSGALPEENQDNFFKEFFKSWMNPVIGVSKDRTLEAQLDFTLPKRRRTATGTDGLVFTKANLNDIKVIGQVDNKFIACQVSILNEDREPSKILLLVDQHAAHERIRLEQLQEQFLDSQEQPKGTVRSKAINPPIHLHLAVPADQPLRTFKNAFEKIGINYAIKSELKMEEKIYIELVVSKMPAIFVESQGKSSSSGICILEHAAIKEVFQDHMRKYQESSFSASVIPHSIHNVLCSYACHGAIRFGDPLSLAECQSIIHSLSQCKMPFQCAHGRPSIAPLLNLSSFGAQKDWEKAERLNLQRLRK